MTLRDLGYRPYEGPRNPPSAATWVMFRYGLRRATTPVAMKILLMLSPAPALVMAMASYFAHRFSEGGVEDDAWLSGLLSFEVWLFTGLTGLLVGSTSVSEDLAAKAFPFYFAKPLDVSQYLLGRVLALSLLTFAQIFGGAAIFVLALAGAVPSAVAESLGFLLPVFAEAALVGLVTSAVAIGVSSLSASRAVTMSLWVALWLVPSLVAKIVKVASDQAFLDAAAVPTLLHTVADALLRNTDVEGARLPVGWALAALAAHAGLALLFAHRKLSRPEVVS